MDVLIVGVPEQRGRLERCKGLEAFASRDCEGAPFVGEAEASRALGDIEHGALRGTQGFVAKLCVPDLSGLDANQKLDGNLVSDESVMR